MKTLRIRYSLMIIAASVVVLFFSGRHLISQFGIQSNQPFDVSNITLDEDIKLSNNINYAKAVYAFSKADYNIAIDELTDEIRKYPEHAQAYFLLGKIYEVNEFPEGKFYSKMMTNYESYIKLKPKGKRTNHAKLRIAQHFVKEGLTQQNIGYLTKAENYLKELDQSNSDVRMALGAIYLNQQNYDKAISEFEKSASLPPSELKLKYNSLGLAYIKKKEYAKAGQLLEIAVNIDPTDKFAHNNLGFVYAQQRRLKDAEIHFSAALSLDPTYRNAEKNLQWAKEEQNKQYK